MKPLLLQESRKVSSAGEKEAPTDLTNLVKAMRDLATRVRHMGGSDPNVAAIASSLADLGQMAAAIGERVLKLEGRFVNECKSKEALQA